MSTGSRSLRSKRRAAVALVVLRARSAWRCRLFRSAPAVYMLAALAGAACDDDSNERDRSQSLALVNHHDHRPAASGELVEASDPASMLEDWEDWELLGVVPQIEPSVEELAAAAAFAGDGVDSELFEGEYSAMLVLADGTAYGRVGSPTNVPEVSPEQSVGIPEDYDPGVAELGGAPAAGQEGVGIDWILDHAEELIASAGPEDQGRILELTVALPGPSTVLLGGSDNRSVVNNATTLTTYPWRTVGNVLYSGTDSDDGGCTATKIGPRHAITAAHCLHDCNGTWFSDLYFAPGQQGETMNNGGPRAMVARYARTCALSADYGLIILADSSSFAGLGWIGYGWWDDLDDYDGKSVYVRGYPAYNQTCSTSPRGDDKCGGYMYSHLTNLPNVAHQSGYIYHSSDTTGGQSGSSVIHFVDGLPYTLGQHKRGNEPSSGATITASPATYNIAPRMRSAVWDDICTWIGAWPSDYASHPCD